MTNEEVIEILNVWGPEAIEKGLITEQEVYDALGSESDKGSYKYESGFSDVSGPSDIPDDFPKDEGGIPEILIGAGKEEASNQVKNVLDSIDKTGYITNQMSAEDIKNLGEKNGETKYF